MIKEKRDKQTAAVTASTTISTTGTTTTEDTSTINSPSVSPSIISSTTATTTTTTTTTTAETTTTGDCTVTDAGQSTSTPATTTTTTKSSSSSPPGQIIAATATIKEEIDKIDPNITIKREDESPSGSSGSGNGSSNINNEFSNIKNLNNNSNDSNSSTAGLIGSTNTGSVEQNEHENSSNNNEILKTEENSSVTNSITVKREEDQQTDNFSQQQIQHSESTVNIQSLPSNVISKQSGGMEYMQQQSQIFVFSTALANKGAENVINNHYPSIIAYHCAQPGTKKFLDEFFQKHPLKLGQFNRQSSNQWHNISMMKNKTNCRTTGQQQSIKHRQQQINQNFEQETETWDHQQILTDVQTNGQQTEQQQQQNLDIDCLVQQQQQTNSPSPNLNNLQPSLRGVKVPDEDLTPQQRQHRDEQLARLRKMQNLFFPEQDSTNDEQKLNSGCQQQLQQQQMRPICPSGMMVGGGQRPQGLCRPIGPGMMQQENIMNDLMNCGSIGNQQNHMMNHQQQQMMSGGGMISGGPSCPQQSMIHQQQQQQQMMVGGGGPMMNQCMSPGIIQGHKRQMIGGGGGGSGGPPHGTNSVAAQIEWHKLQHEYFEERKIKPSGGGLRNQQQQQQQQQQQPQNQRLQGPPPPYHQTTRSASVPIAIQSPNPGSPINNNPTSNLSLPSPRPGSTLSSPADLQQQRQQLGFKQSPTSQDSPQHHQQQQQQQTVRNLTQSNPSTPISLNLSPNASLKDVDLIVKEPNLMPVPSPQQIQYLNSFEGQELTIQKQPNTSLKDNNSISPSSDTNFSTITTVTSTSSTITTTSTTVSCDNRISGPSTPLTPSSMNDIRYPSTPDEKIRLNSNSAGPSPQGSRPPSINNNENQQQSTTSTDQCRFPSESPSHNNYSSPVPTSKVDVVPPGYSCGRSDNLPLNPNISVAIGGNTKTSHFDPISSLAQMSQQLTSTGTINGQPGGTGGSVVVSSQQQQQIGQPSGHMLPSGFNQHMMVPNDQQMSMIGHQHMQQDVMLGQMDCSMGGGGGGGYSMHNQMGSMSPKLNSMIGGGGYPGMQRMMGGGGGGGRPPILGGGPGYNGANIQVKASAPNTIQYLPARPQVGNQNPRGPPSLDFLQRFANPMSGSVGSGGVMDNQKIMNQQNMQYFQNCNQMGQNMSGMQQHSIENSMLVDGSMGSMLPMVGGGGMMGQQMMLRGMRPQQINQQQMMRMQVPSQQSHMIGGPFNGPEQMFGGGQHIGQQQQQMFVAGSKISPMSGVGPSDTIQPLPPSMGGGGGGGQGQPGQSNFKTSQFVGPQTSDPNYAQQFHNFQQQLYATTPRSQQGGIGPNPNQQFFMPNK